MKIKLYAALLLTPVCFIIYPFATFALETRDEPSVDNHALNPTLVSDNVAGNNASSSVRMKAKLTFPANGNYPTKAVSDDFRLTSNINFNDTYNTNVLLNRPTSSDRSNNTDLDGSRILGELVFDQLNVENSRDIEGSLKVTLNDSEEITLPVQISLRPQKSPAESVLVSIEIPDKEFQQYGNPLGDSSYYFDFLGGLVADYGTGQPKMVFDVKNGEDLRVNLIGKLYRVDQ